MALNPIIVAGAYNVGTAMSTNGCFFATTLSAGIFTFLMGLVVNVPVALAPGMGLNAYFTTIAPACIGTNPTGAIGYKGYPDCPNWGIIMILSLSLLILH